MEEYIDCIHLFDTEAEFTSAYTNDYTEPWVSYCMETSGLSFNKGATPPSPSHDYVEIGGIKWATMNLGATAVTDYGKYYAWGETTGYYANQVPTIKSFEWADYELCDGTYQNMTKYNSSDGLRTLQPIDDAVSREWGGNWRMPTFSEWTSFLESVNTGWSDDYQGSGIAGYVCTDKTDSTKTLFFPAAGHAGQGEVFDIDSYGYYWSSTLTNNDVNMPRGNDFNAGGEYWDLRRNYGCSVRGILDE